MGESPYRTGRQDEPRARTRGGVVDDMVRQFADPYAFLRELVQNAIDAGTRTVEVGLRRVEDGTVRTWVADDGEGMSREVIETCLLRSFASSKEEQQGKIGKYGIGFLSVLALEPAEVVVDTWTPDAAFTVRLFPNQSYRLERGVARSPGSGTVVTLVQSLSSEAFARHADRVRQSLKHWCRHVTIPLTLEGPRMEEPERLDEPFELVAPATVRITEADFTALIGCEAGCAFLPDAASSPEGAGSFAGFYNGGLTLYETVEERFDGLDGLRVKLMSSALHHTISRDNVRRDDDFRRLLLRASEAAKESLPNELRSRVGEVAARVARNGWSLAAQGVFVASIVHLPLGDISLPLTDPIYGKASMSADEVCRRTPRGTPCLVASRPSLLTRLLAEQGRPVVRGDESHQQQRAGANDLLASLLQPNQLAHAEALLFAAAAQQPTSAAESALCGEVEASLRAAGLAARRVGLFKPIATTLERSSLAVRSRSSSEFFVSRTDLNERAAIDSHDDHEILLNVEDQAVQLAVTRCADIRQARHVGALLARIVLLESCNTIPPGASEALVLRSASVAGTGNVA